MSNASAAPTYKSGKQSVAPAGADANDGARASAVQFLADLAAELSKGNVDLPCFPDIVLRIRKALADPHTTPEHTVTVVGAEPRLVARLLQTANSAAFNPSGRPFTDLRTAITRLGHQLVQSAAMAFAVQQMKDEQSLRAIAKPMTQLWKESISVALIAQVVARRTKVTPDEAFITGLLHGIGRLYIMVRAAGGPTPMNENQAFMDMVSGWHASIGKSVLENWGFAGELYDAVGDQGEYDRRARHHDPDLTDILVVSIVLGEELGKPKPRTVRTEGVTAFQAVGLTAQDCNTILTHAEYQLGSLQDALGC